MKLPGWYGIAVGLLMLAQWAIFLATGNVPELQTEPLRIGFHLVGEFVTAIGLIVAGTALLRGLPWAASVYLLAAGMLLYTVIVSPGYFAQQGGWAMVGMFGALFVLTLASIATILWSERG
jgi:hypothetical protein